MTTYGDEHFITTVLAKKETLVKTGITTHVKK